MLSNSNPQRTERERARERKKNEWRKKGDVEKQRRRSNRSIFLVIFFNGERQTERSRWILGEQWIGTVKNTSINIVSCFSVPLATHVRTVDENANTASFWVNRRRLSLSLVARFFGDVSLSLLIPTIISVLSLRESMCCLSKTSLEKHVTVIHPYASASSLASEAL